MNKMFLKVAFKTLPFFKTLLLAWYTAISMKVVPEQSGKVEYERERLAGNR
jgi:hypothetical protein